jgi:hypothetical protein
MSDELPRKILCIRVTGPNDAIRAFLSRHPTEPNAVERTGDKISVELFVPEPVIDEIDKKQLRVKVLYDASARGRERQKEVGRGNRFHGDVKRFRGLGTKTTGEPR